MQIGLFWSFKLWKTLENQTDVSMENSHRIHYSLEYLNQFNTLMVIFWLKMLLMKVVLVPGELRWVLRQ
jgi:hypothetical protein